MSEKNPVFCKDCQQRVKIERSKSTTFCFVSCACNKQGYPVSENKVAEKLGISVALLRHIAMPMTLSDVPCSC